MSVTYDRPSVPRTALRLHFNEHTGGCSPAVLQAVRALGETDVSFYPDYDEVHARTAAWFGVPREWVVLTNGMDEGIFAAAVAQMRPYVAHERAGRPEILIPTPAFEEYLAVADAVGARTVAVPADGSLAFPLDGLLARITPDTRLLYVTSPGNPSGLLVSPDAVRTLSAALPPGALVFLDEAYVDFADEPSRASYLGRLADSPNVVIGRTFSKAHGLAGLRAGALIGAPATVATLAAIVPPYSLNTFAVSGLMAALDDGASFDAYKRDVVRSRQRIYDACGRLGLPCWRSQANFVLVEAGARAERLAAGLRARGIYVRLLAARPDAGTPACIRITAGVLAHTERCLAALEDVLCDEPR